MRSYLVMSALLAVLSLSFAPFDARAQKWQWSVYTQENSLLGDNFVLSVGIDSSGHYWTGTMSAGLYEFDGREWTRYDKSNSPLPSDTVISILVHPDGTRWFGTHGGGVVSYGRSGWHVYNTENSGLKSNDISGNGFILGADGSLWVGTWGGGVSRYRDGEWITYDTNNSQIPHSVVWSACVDTSGAIWFGTLDGLAQFSGGDWKIFTTENSSLPLDDVAALYPNPDGSIWIGTWGKGIAWFNGESEWELFDSANSSLPGNFVEALTTDKRGRLWIGSWGGGVALYKEGRWTIQDSSNSGLLSNNIRTILHEKEAARMWICSEHGLAICDYEVPVSAVDFPPALDAQTLVTFLPGPEPRVRVNTSEVGRFSLHLFDLTGASVAVLADGLLSFGSHVFAVPDDLSNGFYYCVVYRDGLPVGAIPVIVAR